MGSQKPDEYKSYFIGIALLSLVILFLLFLAYVKNLVTFKYAVLYWCAITGAITIVSIIDIVIKRRKNI